MKIYELYETESDVRAERECWPFCIFLEGVLGVLGSITISCMNIKYSQRTAQILQLLRCANVELRGKYQMRSHIV